MVKKINDFAYRWATSSNPWTNVYGFGRSLIAFAMAFALICNDASIFFRPASGQEDFPLCSGVVSYYCIGSHNYTTLNLLRWIAVVLLLIIASGWRPRWTGVIHWWLAYSLQNSGMTLDGGEQVATVITLLLIPITLTDSRKWHWEKTASVETFTDGLVTRRLIALVSLVAIRVQMAILYFDSSVAKMFETTWGDGTAVFYFMRDPMFGLPPLIRHFSDVILASPFVVVPTWGTLILQFSLFGALFAPKKYWRTFLVLALLMHEVIAVMLGLITFSMIMAASLCLYLRPIEQEYSFKIFTSLFSRGKVLIIDTFAKRRKGGGYIQHELE